ncbi:hypothetical protein GUJ93_ZPchr0007g3829 [Zizania palustris]|uniref:Uncharacterized protein n=1 Tax=Zizania palustris TaxID=103762 RepID=A0A8J5TBY5_ZIZPA|nr:hypothetical protein GUJ93_ZPchr0007g3829 [Zizania palustris]
MASAMAEVVEDSEDMLTRLFGGAARLGKEREGQDQIARIPCRKRGSGREAASWGSFSVGCRVSGRSGAARRGRKIFYETRGLNILGLSFDGRIFI